MSYKLFNYLKSENTPELSQAKSRRTQAAASGMPLFVVVSRTGKAKVWVLSTFS